MLLLIVTSVLLAKASLIADELYRSDRCHELSTDQRCEQYKRCKNTNRCGQGDEDYEIEKGQLSFYDRKHNGGNRTQISLMNDFEDWKTGTHHWKAKGYWTNPYRATVGLNTFDFNIIGVLELSSGYILFDTTTATISGDIELNGIVGTTSRGTEVAVFNFASVYLGDNVQVQVKGSRALSILSRSSMIIDTEIHLPPGMIGGFPGGGYPADNNINGPGSSSTRVYVKTVRTLASDIDEIQEIETFTDDGQTIGGHFVIRFRGESTHDIAFDADAATVERHMETALSTIGDVHVEEVGTTNPIIGRIWRITFLTAIGDVPELQVESRLTGINSNVVARTILHGNSISGHFKLRFMGLDTRSIPHDASAQFVQEAVLEDFTGILQAVVTRTDPLNRCVQGAAATSPVVTSELNAYAEWNVPNARVTGTSYHNKEDALCESGRGPAGGYIWKLELTTRIGNVIPTSVTSADASVVAPKETLYAVITEDREGFTVPILLGHGAAVDVQDALCFSLSFGGSGGSYGGQGGNGYSSADTMGSYNSQGINDLLGGSGGAAGGRQPFDILPFVRPILGGAGGGAILLSAINDLTLGANCVISADGSGGESGLEAAGGGSGGTILITSRATVVHMGKLSVNGGNGGTCDKSLAEAQSGGGGGAGRIAVYAESYVPWAVSTAKANGGVAQDANGGDGTIHVDSHSALAVRVDPLLGAAGSFKSLLVVGSEPYVTSADHKDYAPGAINGPQYLFTHLDNPVNRPTRVSYFVRIGDLLEGGVESNRGAIAGLHDENTNDQILIGVGITDGWFTHEANFYDYPRKRFHEKVQTNRWYKVDIFINWKTKTYNVHLNDVEKVYQASFVGETVTALGLYNYHHMATWWDEIYVGIDYTMRFRCPEATAESVKLSHRGRKLWPGSVVGQTTEYMEKIRHESHLPNDGSLNQLDGDPHIRYVNDILQDPNINLYESSEDIGGGEMLYVHSHQDNSMFDPLEPYIDDITLTMAGSSGTYNNVDQASQVEKRATYYWYSEVYEGNTNGGIGACSTTDYITWKNEGIMLHFSNLTDPFGDPWSGILIAERPKVLLNEETAHFVMWMHIDTRANEMGLTGVATSEYPNGPFSLRRSFYPDAPLEAPGGLAINETHDQTVFTQPDGSAYLVRSYYKSVNYWLPRAVMDPIWQSVKTQDGATDFGMNYHRAVFHEGYDDVDDIYIQRWRLEDQPWKILCCSPEGECDVHTKLPEQGHKGVCPENKIKRVVGQGVIPIESRYKDPHSLENNEFRASAVPSHTTWGHQVYNVKTWRGNYFDALSTNITRLVFQRYAGERAKRNVTSNGTQYEYPNAFERLDKINITDTEIMDLMLNTLGVPVSDELRAKYSIYDLRELDQNIDGKVTADELSNLVSSTKVKNDLKQNLLDDYHDLKTTALVDLDPNLDGFIEYSEFRDWLGLDPDLIFDRFDLDKSGYLDENELARLLEYRLVPRIDTVMILLDPDFDGRVYFSRFEKWLYNAPVFIFDKYDFDKSKDLDQNERDQLYSDIGSFFESTPENIATFQDLVNPNTNRLPYAAYKQWFSKSTSLIRNSRSKLRADNAVHSTRPDSLTGPQHVVETRRAKYVAISQLTEDYTATKGLLAEIEGDFEGDAALINALQGSVQLFNLKSDSEGKEHVPFRRFLSPEDLGHRATYWNGYEMEGRPSAPVHFLYAKECSNIAGTEEGCPDCLNKSPYVSEKAHDYQTEQSSWKHCNPSKIMNAYVKAFDQQANIMLRYQQFSQEGLQGIQPHYSPCVNQSEWVPCDIHKVAEGGIGNMLDEDATKWNLAWRNHPSNKYSSQKIRASPTQEISHGFSFAERFPLRERAPKENIDGELYPDQMDSPIRGGG